MRKIAEETFLYTILGAICRQESFSMIKNNMETIKLFGLPGGEILNKVSDALWNSLFEGFHNAVEKYGENEGGRRIGDRIVEILIKNSIVPITREDIMKRVCITDMQASILSKGNGGFTFSVDENGNYSKI